MLGLVTADGLVFARPLGMRCRDAPGGTFLVVKSAIAATILEK